MKRAPCDNYIRDARGIFRCRLGGIQCTRQTDLRCDPRRRAECDAALRRMLADHPPASTFPKKEPENPK